MLFRSGFGTTAAAFRAGIPAVVVPHIIDQFIWGRKVAELGVGPQPVPRRKLTAQTLATALDAAANDAAMRATAAELGAAIRAEDGLATAVALIEEAAA